jgi:hypothetical protein
MLARCRRELEVPGPIAACVSHSATQFVLQQLGKVMYISINSKVWKGAMIPSHDLHQLQAAEDHVAMMVR